MSRVRGLARAVPAPLRGLARAVPAPLRSLRARVTAIVVFACAAGLLVAGVAVLTADDHDARSALDRDLQRRADLLGGTAGGVGLVTPMPAGIRFVQAGGGFAGPLLAGTAPTGPAFRVARGRILWLEPGQVAGIARGPVPAPAPGAVTGVVRTRIGGASAAGGVNSQIQQTNSLTVAPGPPQVDVSPAFAAANKRFRLPPGFAPKLSPSQLRTLKRVFGAAAQRQAGVLTKSFNSQQRLLLGSGVFSAEIIGGRVAKQAGDLHGSVPVQRGSGYGTVEIAGQPWRTLTVAQQTGAAFEVGEQLGPTLAQVASTRRLVITIGIALLVLIGLAVWALVGLALRPLRRLRAGAERVTHTRDLDSRLAAGDGPEEIDALARSLNAMLARLAESSAATEQALNATRRFAADTGHELRTPLTSMQANVETLLHNPELKLAERRRILADVAHEQRRLVDLLGALQTLARGDAATAIPREQVDLVEVLEQSVQAARRRHPALNLSIVGAPDGLTIQGWPEGLRVLLDNLLENAALHAGETARVEVSLNARGNEATLTVDDNGPGIPLNDRVRLLERFERGVTPTPRGSGLGLALVRQQARLHGGDARIEDSPLGGARLRITLHASPGEGRPGRADNAVHQQRPVRANT